MPPEHYQTNAKTSACSTLVCFLFKLGDDRCGLWHPKFCTNCDLSLPKQNKLLFLHFSFCIIVSPEGKLCMLPSCCTALMQAWNTLLFECAPSFPNYGSFLRFEVNFFLDYLKLGVKFLVCSLDCLCALKRSVQECCILNTLKKKSLSDKITLSFQLAYAKSGFISGSGTWDGGPKLEVPVYGGNTNPKEMGLQKRSSQARSTCERCTGLLPEELGGR